MMCFAKNKNKKQQRKTGPDSNTLLKVWTAGLVLAAGGAVVVTTTGGGVESGVRQYSTVGGR